MRKVLIASTLILIAQTSAAFAAGPFDGSWSGEAAGSDPAANACTGPVKGTVENNVLHGEITICKYKPIAFGGPVAADGSFKSPAGRITGQFTGKSFVGGMTVPNGYCNPYKLTMSRG